MLVKYHGEVKTQVICYITDNLNVGASGVSDYDQLQNKPITRVISTDASNPVILRDLDSGIYMLHGAFKGFAGSQSTKFAQTPIQAIVTKSTAKSYIQLFFPFNNQLQYFEVTDTEETSKTINFNDLVN